MPRPLRVLHLRDSPWVDGPGRTILETAKRIDRSRIDYHVGVFVSKTDDSHPLIHALQEEGLPAHAIPDQGGVGPKMVEHLVALIDLLQIDVLHTSEFRSNVLGLLCRRRRPVKLVSTAHGWIANDLRGHFCTLADLFLLKTFDRVILVSRAMRRRLPAWWVPDQKVHVLQNALMTDSYGQEFLNIPRRVANPHGEIRILNVGRLSPEKGQALLLQVVAKLVPDCPGIQLLLAGVGPCEKELRLAAKQLGLADRVQFLGFVHDMPRLYSTVDLVVQSSTTEGMPNVILEALYLRAPVVATNVGGTAEVVENGVTGWLVDAPTVRDLTDGVRRFLQNPAEAAQMARRGHSHIVENFSIDVRTNRQTQLYEELARGTR